MSPTLAFHAALMQAEAQARSTLDVALHERLSAAVSLVKDGRVFQTSTGEWQVQSASQAGVAYTVNGVCSCHDHHYNHPPHGLCKHRLSMFLAQRVVTLMHQPSVPVVPVETAPALPTSTRTPCEPPAADAAAPRERSGMRLETQVTIDGRQVKVAVWGPDDADVQARLAAVLAQHPVQAPAPQSQPSQGQEGWCAIHNTALHVNHGKDGRSWYSHRLPEGGFCKGKRVRHG